MKDTRQQLITGFAPGEREYVRRELGQFFSTLSTVAEEFRLRVWSGGQQDGELKIPPRAKSLLARGLMRLDASQRPPDDRHHQRGSRGPAWGSAASDRRHALTQVETLPTVHACGMVYRYRVPG
jgi:hypothetical protein